MQMRVLALALLALGASARRAESSTSLTATASAWLRAHGPSPAKDELADLRAENPEAYALVNALLTKRSLGLLDPKHPTASFAPAQAQQAAPAEQMSSVDFAKSQNVAAPASSDSDDVEEVVAPVHHSHKDWLNWRPSDSAADDAAQVQQVLGAAASLKSGAAAAEPVEQLAAPPPAQPVAVQPIQPAQPVQVQSIQPIKPVSVPSLEPDAPAPKPVAAAVEENSYLKGIDLGASSAPVAAAPKASENSYLKGIDLTGKKEGLVGVKNTVASDNHNFLKEFTWSDDNGNTVQVTDDHPLPPAHIVSQDEALPAARVLSPFGSSPEGADAQQEAATTPAPKKQNALVSWLGSSWGPVKKSDDAQKSASKPAVRGGGHYLSYLA